MLERTQRPELAAQRQPQPGSPPPEYTTLAQFHTRIVNSPAFSQLSEQRQALITSYLTTNTPLRKLAKAELLSHEGVRHRIRTGIHELWPHLPEEVQAEYQSPEHIIALREQAQEQRRRQTSPKKAAITRWERYREQKQQERNIQTQ